MAKGSSDEMLVHSHDYYGVVLLHHQENKKNPWRGGGTIIYHSLQSSFVKHLGSADFVRLALLGDNLYVNNVAVVY